MLRFLSDASSNACTGGVDLQVAARRMIVIATEDVGLADPQAMQVAYQAWQNYQAIGAVEGERFLAQAAIYLACALGKSCSRSSMETSQAMCQSLIYDAAACKVVYIGLDGV